MNQQAYIFEVSEPGFPEYVLANSHTRPVLVEFMGVWSEPCVLMADSLHALAQEFAGQFVFAKVDVDEQPGLREKYKVQNVPTLLVFKDGDITFTQEGQLGEAELRVLLKGLGVYSESEELREQARAKHMAGDTQEAVMLLTRAIQNDPANTRVALDMVQIFIDVGELEQAKALFNKLPDRDKQSDMGKSLIGQLTFADLAEATAGVTALKQRLAKDGDDHDARFDLAVCLVSQHNYDDAMENLITLLQRRPDYKDGAAREMIITISNMLAANDPERAAGYRQRLASLLNK